MQAELSERLTMMLRPAGGGVYVVSTGLKEQKALQRVFRAARDHSLLYNIYNCVFFL